MLCAAVQTSAFASVLFCAISDSPGLLGNLSFVGLASLAHGILTTSSAKVSTFMRVDCERDGFCQNASMFPLVALIGADMTHPRP